MQDRDNSFINKKRCCFAGHSQIENSEVVDEAFVKAMFKEIQKEHGIKGKNLFMGSRIILTGQMHGPDLPKTMEVLGKEDCLNRIVYVKNNIL